MFFLRKIYFRSAFLFWSICNMSAFAIFFKMEKIGLAKWILDICKKKNFKFVTPLQQAVIPAILAGKDLLLFARTGTGKTMAFILPSLQLIDENKKIARSVILIPNRELGFQIFDICTSFEESRTFTTYFLNQKNLTDNLYRFNYAKTTKTCLISTPKFFCWFLIVKKLKIKNLKLFLIIDEADFLLSNVYYDALDIILSKVKPKQILLSSASLTKSIHLLKFPRYKKQIFCFHEKKKKFSLITNAPQEYIFCPSHLKILFLATILKKKYKNTVNYDEKEHFSTIVFVPSAKICENLKHNLDKKNISSLCLNAKMTENARLITIQMLKTLKIKVVFCTDIGSRGLDLPNVNLVINYNFPKNISTYVHRAGRTSRFFKKGLCLNLLCQKEVQYLHFLEKQTGLFINRSCFLTEYEILKILSN